MENKSTLQHRSVDLFSTFLYKLCFFQISKHSLYYPEEKGKKPFDRKELSTELCGFASLHANIDYEILIIIIQPLAVHQSLTTDIVYVP